MHSIYLASIAFVIVSLGSGLYASRFPGQSEDRAIYGAYAGVCVLGAVLFCGLGWWVAR